MQSGPLTRDVFVRPTRDFPHERGDLWKLLKMPYGMRDAGRQWLLKIEEWMVNDYEMERIPGVPQLLVKRSAAQIKLLVAKSTDNLIVPGKSEDIRHFMRGSEKALKLGKLSIGGTIRFMGCEVDVGDELVELSMWDYLCTIKKVKLFI